jgi:hypothetical protein
LKERYLELVNTNARRGDLEEDRNLNFVSEKKAGGAEGARTPDLLNAIEALSQLSYSPARFKYSRGSVPAQGTVSPHNLW